MGHTSMGLKITRPDQKVESTRFYAEALGAVMRGLCVFRTDTTTFWIIHTTASAFAVSPRHKLHAELLEDWGSFINNLQVKQVTT